MTCQRINEYLDDFVDGELDSALHRELETHVEGCADCRAKLDAEWSFRKSLSSIPVAPATPGFFDRAMKAVEESSDSDDATTQSRWWSFGVGGAIAAAITVWVMAGSVFTGHDSVLSDEIPGLTFALDELRTVNLVFDSTEALPDATLIVQLPAAIEIDGYDGRQEIRWSTDIEAGKNILALPLVARAVGSGELIARVEHDGKAKTFTVKVSVI